MKINDQIVEAIRTKKWVTIAYHEDNEPITSIKPIFTGDSSFGDYFVYAWGWHSGEPGYYRFDIEKIKEVVPLKGPEPDDNEERDSFEYPRWVASLREYREDYLPWVVSGHR